MKDVGLLHDSRIRTFVLKMEFRQARRVYECLRWAARNNGRWAKNDSRVVGAQRRQFAGVKIVISYRVMIVRLKDRSLFG